MKNHILTWPALLALPDGTQVYVEHDEFGSDYGWDGVYKFKRGTPSRLIAQDDEDEGWQLNNDGMTAYGKWFRVWALPKEPTAEELQGAPAWEV